MKRTCLIPSVTALACADTAAVPGYTPPPPPPPPRPFAHEYAGGISRGSKTLLSDSRSDIKSRRETLAPLPTTLKVKRCMAAPLSRVLVQRLA